MRALIDADSLIYIIGWHHRESVLDGSAPSVEAEDGVKASCDQFLKDILTITNATTYIGVFSTKSFRHERYKYANYKGNRPEKEPWLKIWEPVIKEYYINQHGFFALESLEADDVVAAGSVLLQREGESCIIASPDKDMRQIQGLHYNYKPSKAADGMEIMSSVVETVTPQQAHRNFWKQVIMGDDGDNVRGVPGLGEVKVNALLDAAMDDIQYGSIAKAAYAKYFGGYYGPIIFQETKDTIQLLGPGHTFWENAQRGIHEALEKNIKTPRTSEGYFDLSR